MKAHGFGKYLWPLMAAIMVAFFSALAHGQCAMCRAAFDGASGAKMAKSLNQGIIVLLIPPVLIFCAFFITAIKYRKTPDEVLKNNS
jgi:hypothetical protein